MLAKTLKCVLADGLTKHGPDTVGILLKGTAAGIVATVAHFGAGVDFKSVFSGIAVGALGLGAKGVASRRRPR